MEEGLFVGGLVDTAYRNATKAEKPFRRYIFVSYDCNMILTLSNLDGKCQKTTGQRSRFTKKSDKMRFTHIEVNFDITDEGHQNWLNTSFRKIVKTSQNWLKLSKTVRNGWSSGSVHKFKKWNNGLIKWTFGLLESWAPHKGNLATCCWILHKFIASVYFFMKWMGRIESFTHLSGTDHSSPDENNRTIIMWQKHAASHCFVPFCFIACWSFKQGCLSVFWA